MGCDGIEVYSISAPVPEFEWVLISQFGTGAALRQFEQYIIYGFVTVFFTLSILVLLLRS